MRTTARSQPNIGRAEMEILRYISDHHPVSVREVADYVSATKGQVRTTALNVMERLRKKGCLKRRKVSGIFQYSPSVPRAELLRSLVREFVNRTLGGSLSPFVAYLTQEGKLSAGELAELRTLVQEMDREKPQGTAMNTWILHLNPLAAAWLAAIWARPGRAVSPCSWFGRSAALSIVFPPAPSHGSGGWPI